MHKIWETWNQFLWDWNGTLINDIEVCLEIINECLAKRSLPLLTRERYLDVFEFPVINYYRAIGFDLEKEPFELVGQEFIDAYNRRMFECSLHTGTMQLLEKIRAHSMPQFILSALHQTSLKKVIGHFRLDAFFSDVRGLDNHNAHSKIELGKQLLTESVKSGARTVMIGDTLHDFDTASALGVDCVLVAGGHNSYERLKKTGVPVYHSLVELL
ncbi:MAG: HAD family hydrolase [Candidatus Riflebacteria bacterium]|nr:HAD family hydrolase [Candidatus Riflebacteria bacterium]